MSYEPHPSTVAYRAIEILKHLPLGQTIATAPLAERLGTDTATVLTGLQTAVKHGLVIRERKLGLYHWRMGDGTPASAGPADEPPPAPPPPRQFPGVNIDGPKREPAQAAAPDPKPAPPPEEMRDLITAQPDAPARRRKRAPVRPVPLGTAAHPHEFQFAWCNNGEITLSKGGAAIVLHPEEYAELARFIRVIREFRP